MDDVKLHDRGRRWYEDWRWGLAGCFGFMVLGVAAVGLVFLALMASFRSSDVYQEALSRARASSLVAESVGKPVEPGFFVMGNINVEYKAGGHSTGEADLRIPISGPKGSGTIVSEATKVGGEWQFSRLVVEVAGRGAIDLLE